MKIVGTINSRNFLAELTIQEIDFLAGKKVGSEKGYYGNEREIVSGTTFNIVKAFEQIHRNDRRREEVDRVRQALTFLLNGLDMIEPLIEDPKQEEQKAE